MKIAKADRKKMKGWKRVLLILLLIPVVIAAILGGLYLYADNKPDIINGYDTIWKPKKMKEV